jgi:hypothetical protein
MDTTQALALLGGLSALALLMLALPVAGAPELMPVALRRGYAATLLRSSSARTRRSAHQLRPASDAASVRARR